MFELLETVSSCLRYVATLPWKTKNSNFLQMWKKRKQIAFFHRVCRKFEVLIFKGSVATCLKRDG